MPDTVWRILSGRANRTPGLSPLSPLTNRPSSPQGLCLIEFTRMHVFDRQQPHVSRPRQRENCEKLFQLRFDGIDIRFSRHCLENLVGRANRTPGLSPLSPLTNSPPPQPPTPAIPPQSSPSPNSHRSPSRSTAQYTADHQPRFGSFTIPLRLSVFTRYWSIIHSSAERLPRR